MGKNDVPETQQEKTLSQVSVDKWNDHQKRLVPLENQVIANANRDPELAQVKAAGAVNADMAQASAPALVNPNMARTTSATPALALASKTAQAQVNAGQTVQDQHASALGNVVAMGEGKAASATQGFETAASNATNTAINQTQNNAAIRQSIGSAALSLAGTAVSLGTRPTPAGNIEDFSTSGQQAAINGAGTGPGSYRYDKASGNFYWND